MEVIEALLVRLDEGDLRQRENIVFKLRNSPALNVAEALSAFMQAQSDLASADPDLVSSYEQMEKEVIIIPETVSNSLLINASPAYFDQMQAFVMELDRAPAQVAIKALIVEVELDDNDEFGIELGFQDSLLFDRGLLNGDNFQTIQQTLSDPSTGIVTTTDIVVNSEFLPGFPFNNFPLGNNTAIHPGGVGKQVLSNFNLGRVNGDLGYGGLVLSAGSESVNVLLRALSSTRKLEILSAPMIQALDNQEAQIQVGQEVPRIDGFATNATTNVITPTFTQQIVGITLFVTPRISPDGQIVMEVVARKDELTSVGVTLTIDQNGNPITSPILNITEVRTSVTVANNQTIVLAGLITRREETIERKVPWLGDIPVLGRAFRIDTHSTRRKELLIFLTPRIVQTHADHERIKQIEIERMRGFNEEMAEELHGPLRSAPSELPPGEARPMDDGYGKVPTTKMPGGKKSNVPPPAPKPEGASLSPNSHSNNSASVSATLTPSWFGKKSNRQKKSLFRSRWNPFGSKAVRNEVVLKD
jgi:type II secretory pathway component GspD/PulD (secretin)